MQANMRNLRRREKRRAKWYLDPITCRASGSESNRAGLLVVGGDCPAQPPTVPRRCIQPATSSDYCFGRGLQFASWTFQSWRSQSCCSPCRGFGVHSGRLIRCSCFGDCKETLNEFWNRIYSFYHIKPSLSCVRQSIGPQSRIQFPTVFSRLSPTVLLSQNTKPRV